MRNALIVLLAVAAAIVLVGAFSYSLRFDIAYVAGTLTGVSAFWIALALAAVFLVAGLLAAWLARRSLARSCHRLEDELETTYRRLRETEARVLGAASRPVADAGLHERQGGAGAESSTRVIASPSREDDTVELAEDRTTRLPADGASDEAAEQDTVWMEHGTADDDPELRREL